MNLMDIFIRNRGATLQTRMDAETLTENLLRDFDGGEIGDGAYTYDDDKGTVEGFMVAGNGPTAWVVFTRFGSELTAHVEYTDSQGRVLLALPDARVNELYAAFVADKEERDRR